MSMTTMATDDDERWKQWQLHNAKSSHRAGIHARIAIAIVLTGLTAWLGLLLSSPV